jgi:hypothetical protein
VLHKPTSVAPADDNKLEQQLSSNLLGQQQWSQQSLSASNSPASLAQELVVENAKSLQTHIFCPETPILTT